MNERTDICITSNPLNNGAFSRDNDSLLFSVGNKYKSIEMTERERIVDKPFTNKETGITATISNTALSKMISGSAIRKSSNYRAHLAAVDSIDELFTTSILLLKRRGGRNEDRNISFVNRFINGFNFEGEQYIAKITVKEGSV